MHHEQAVFSGELVSVFAPDGDCRDCVIESRSEYIVAGDSHLTDRGVVEGITVFTPRQFANLLKLE